MWWVVRCVLVSFETPERFVDVVCVVACVDCVCVFVWLFYLCCVVWSWSMFALRLCCLCWVVDVRCCRVLLYMCTVWFLTSSLLLLFVVLLAVVLRVSSCVLFDVVLFVLFVSLVLRVYVWCTLVWLMCLSSCVCVSNGFLVFVFL